MVEKQAIGGVKKLSNAMFKIFDARHVVQTMKKKLTSSSKTDYPRRFCSRG